MLALSLCFRGASIVPRGRGCHEERRRTKRARSRKGEDEYMDEYIQTRNGIHTPYEAMQTKSQRLGLDAILIELYAPSLRGVGANKLLLV
jgi:hypothetical protein